MSRRWFGTDGIRGKAGAEPLTPLFLRQLGCALGEVAAASSGLVLLARDTRESGPAIAADLARGLIGAGARVIDLGVVPTAGLPLQVLEGGAALGVMVSASHNPWQDNGVKVFGGNGLKLEDAAEQALELRVAALLSSADDDVDAGADRASAAGTAGPAESADGAVVYTATMERRFAGADLSTLSLAVDCAHGAASATAPPVLTALGARVTVLSDAPDGRNINAGCGSTHLGALAERMTGGGFDLGLAFDGDADRVLMVDAQGRTVTGDHVLAFLGPVLHAAGELPGDTVVGTVMSNLGLQRALAVDGLELLRTPVGDRHVLAAMMAEGLALGGEASGHIVFHEDPRTSPALAPGRDVFIGDGLYTAVRVLSALVATGRSGVSLVDAVPSIPQVLLNVPVSARPPVQGLDALTAAVAAAESQHGDDLRIVLRYSGTEDLARVMVEGLDAAVVDATSAELARIWVEQIAERVQ